MKLLGLFLLPSSGLLWPLTVPQPKARRVLGGGVQESRAQENWSREGMVAMGEGIECRIPPSSALPDSTPKLVFPPHKPHSLAFRSSELNGVS